jgi:hypothetical protein
LEGDAATAPGYPVAVMIGKNAGMSAAEITVLSGDGSND